MVVTGRAHIAEIAGSVAVAIGLVGIEDVAAVVARGGDPVPIGIGAVEEAGAQVAAIWGPIPIAVGWRAIAGIADVADAIAVGGELGGIGPERAVVAQHGHAIALGDDYAALSESSVLLS